MQGLQFILLRSLRGSVAPVAIEAAVAQALLDIDPLLAMPLELAEAAEAFFAQVGVVALEQLGAHPAVLPAVERAQLAAPRARSASEGRVKFYREVELKHGRVAMLAALGFVVGEHFHPLWGGNVDVPSYIAWQETPLQDWMPLVGLVIAIHELTSVFTFNSPFGGEIFSIRSDYASGDLGWDPLGLKPTDAAALKEMQTKEINNGRLAMIAVAGMIGQELAQGSKLF